MDTYILNTIDLSKTYKSNELVVKAVNKVSLQIKPGEFIALVGPSGSGKTTMLAMLATLLESTEGHIYIDGEPFDNMNDKQRAKFRREKIGFTFQDNNLVPYLTAVENVELMLRLNGIYNPVDATRVKNLLLRLGLDEQLNSLPSQMSKGEQQRVAIARSLIHDPRVVLADEPTASLDTQRAKQVVQILSDLIHEEQRAGIMVTHDLRMCKYVDRVIQMVDGTINRIIADPADIDILAGTSEFDKLSTPSLL
ncbi:MAG: ABC transporter ATP-binding protein [Rhodospirillaceae bacterium]|nr:ABC transporter ATP-binding protein [Rhodospirillaceae bacterium]